MPYLLQVDFEMDGHFRNKMFENFKELAKIINSEPGMIWKIWTESPEDKQAGGVYIFDSYENATKYLRMHTKCLTDAGIRNIRARIFEGSQELSAINHAPLMSPSA